MSNRLTTRLHWCLPVLAFVCTDRCEQDAHAQEIVEHAPHVRIDWRRGCVEVDGRVVLRKGMLELFACSPNTREHESVVVVEAQPKRIFEALGLIGLVPGRPIRHDSATDKWLPATGDPVGIEVRWKHDGKTRTVDIGEWMRAVGTNEPVPPGVWRFAGSDRSPGGAFLADVDGTVICVVDFASALVALSESKSADDASLWVRAEAEAIPPVGTSVTLIFSRVEPVRFTIHVSARGAMTFDGKPISMKGLIDRVRRFEADHAFTEVVIEAHPAAAGHSVDTIADGLRRVVRRGTEVRRSKPADKIDRSAGTGHSGVP